MKEFVKNYILFLLLISLVTYIAGSFIDLSFYITLWEESNRAVLGMMWAIILCLYTIAAILADY